MAPVRPMFTKCKLRWMEDPAATIERWGVEFLWTDAGSAYRIDQVKGKTLHCTRWPIDEIPPDAVCLNMVWTSRSPQH